MIDDELYNDDDDDDDDDSISSSSVGSTIENININYRRRGHSIADKNGAGHNRACNNKPPQAKNMNNNNKKNTKGKFIGKKKRIKFSLKL